MKCFLGFVMMLALLSAPALAGKNSQTVNIPATMKVGSTQLSPGDYNVTWVDSGPNVQVTVEQNRKVLVTLPAKLIEKGNKDVGLDTDNQGGVDILQTIRLKNITLILESSPPSEK